ncbi:MAG: hypothetical protein BWY36_00593 [Candidatus Diapherotrites archaeon ADurb.Bin253]|jgi:hypothetical protein|nr:hypothetical protein [Candidatus Pacearchaeota archaeon]OQA67804.1 MAG: hypothetical protein BWY36_00593 [Candidatus Diapherotrites archaeon ADurb.Bin253]HNZ51906.1 hypothetical protein [Candidatus Pacearchaeota archaeon]HOC96925.1 hypothetical protein [Candidatus Pacearchaeota archaeon]HOF44042.1 hypothetical protein [Candidatus Pacearchaeota archaeon]
MSVIKIFEEFLKEGIVKKISIDKNRANNIYLESGRKFKLLQKKIDKLGVDDESANDYIEDCYNILIFLIRAKMLEEGYSSSGQGAHEAEVSYSRKLKFNESDIELLDKLRHFRNGILYYGKRFDKEYAEKIIEFTKKKFKLLNKL